MVRDGVGRRECDPGISGSVVLTLWPALTLAEIVSPPFLTRSRCSRFVGIRRVVDSEEASRCRRYTRLLQEESLSGLYLLALSAQQ